MRYDTTPSTGLESVTSPMPVQRSNQLSYEATAVRSWSFVGSNVPGMNELTNEMIYDTNHIIELQI